MGNANFALRAVALGHDGDAAADKRHAIQRGYVNAAVSSRTGLADIAESVLLKERGYKLLELETCEIQEI